MTTEIKKSPNPVSANARNMIIGVVTTVLVSGTVYLLGFNNKNDKVTKLQKQKATIEAWKTYVLIENHYAKTTAVLMRDSKQFGSVKELYAEIMKEGDQFMVGLNGLIQNENVDKDMVAVLKRRAANEETSRPRVEKFYMELDQLIEIAVENEWNEKQIQDSILARGKIFEEQTKGMMNRAISEIESLAKTLTKRYNETFDTDEFFVIQVYKHKKDMFALLAAEKSDSAITENITRDFFTGVWDASGATVTFRADETWTSFVPVDTSHAEGTWFLKNGQLTMHVDKLSKMPGKFVWTYNLSSITDTSFTMILAVEPYNSFKLVRK